MAGLAHVGHHRAQQVRDAFVDAQFQHLRVDQDQAHRISLGLVQQRQDHRVDADRFAGAGGAGHHAVRHLGQVRHHRLAGDVLAQRHGQLRRALVVDLRAEDLRQAHRLALRVRQLQAHEILAGNRLHHADGDQRQRTRQVLGQVDDLAALHARGRLDLVARDDRARVGRHHLHFHAEVLELLFDQARGELQRLGAHGFLHGRDRVEQRQRRQVGILDIDKQRLLLLAFHALALDDGRGAHDLHRRCFLDAHAAGFDHLLALDLGRLADGAVLLVLAAGLEADEQHLDARADLLGQVQPGEMEEQRQAHREHQQQQQRAAGEAQRVLQRSADQVAQHTARRARQLHVQRMHADRFEAHAGGQDQRETDPGDAGVYARRGRGCVMRRQALVGHQLAPAAPDAAHQQQRPPVGRGAEHEQQHVGEPGADAPAQVAHVVDLAGVRPAGIGFVVGQQNGQEGDGHRQQQKPADLAQQPADAGRQRSGIGSGRRSGGSSSHAGNGCAARHGRRSAWDCAKTTDRL